MRCFVCFCMRVSVKMRVFVFYLHLNITEYQHLKQHGENSYRLMQSICNDLKASQLSDIK